MTRGSAAQRAQQALLSSMAGMLTREVDLKRLCRIATLAGPSPGALSELGDRVRLAQQDDGGWGDIEETIWCLAVLSVLGENFGPVLTSGLGWLRRERASAGAWGMTRRDSSRIPATSLVLRFHGATVGEVSDWERLGGLWSKDLSSVITLTYKGGFYLMASAEGPGPRVQSPEPTLAYLATAQNDDGGFGPWRNHPIGSDPWSTGICLVGLCSFPDLANRQVVERAADWLCRTQLPSGYWAYHFIDEGSAYAYWGLTEAIRFLERN